MQAETKQINNNEPIMKNGSGEKKPIADEKPDDVRVIPVNDTNQIVYGFNLP